MKPRSGFTYYYDPLQCILDPTPERRALFLGSVLALSQGLLHAHRIGAVISLNSEALDADLDDQFPEHRLYIPAQDHQTFRLSVYFCQCIQFIQLHLPFRNVLVHCYAGVSRSATIVLAFLLHQGAPLPQALQLVKQRRPIVCPNPGFMRQLQEFESQIANQAAGEQGSQKQINQQVEPTPALRIKKSRKYPRQVRSFKGLPQRSISLCHNADRTPGKKKALSQLQLQQVRRRAGFLSRVIRVKRTNC